MQVEEDLQNGVAGAVPIPHDDAGKEEVIAALVTNVEAMIKADRKITSLKQLQVSRGLFGYHINFKELYFLAVPYFDLLHIQSFRVIFGGLVFSIMS